MKRALLLLTALFTFEITLLIPAAARAGVSLFPETGQTTSYAPGDDGDLKAGVPWPEPRFVDNGNGTVTDNLTGLVWLKKANCYGVAATDYLIWSDVLPAVNKLASGACGLTDGSTAGAWRLPNINELKSLVNLQQSDQSFWLNSVGFTGVQPGGVPGYWSSTTCVSTGDSVGHYAWIVYMADGSVGCGSGKGYFNYVWPVRSGQ